MQSMRSHISYSVSLLDAVMALRSHRSRSPFGASTEPAEFEPGFFQNTARGMAAGMKELGGLPKAWDERARIMDFQRVCYYQ